jgi:hypothetical protein
VHRPSRQAVEISRSGGGPLERAARERLERGLGESLDDVRVHTDAHAGALARAVSARALTVGSDLFFAAGAYQPGSPDGDKLIAHEVTHSVQQRSGPASGPLNLSAPGDAAEFEAEAMASTLQAEANAHTLPARADANLPRTDGAARAVRGTAISIARMVNPTSDDYQRGYNDGRAANPAAPGPLSLDALDGYNEGYRNGKARADAAQASLPPATPDSTTGPAPDSTAPSTDAAADQTGALTSTGAEATEEPTSYQAGGLPAFRYNFPPGPIAKTHVDTPEASVDFELSLRGNATVTFPNAPANVSFDVDTGGWRFQATQALGGLTAGLRVNGIGTDKPSLGATLGTRFNQTEVRLIPPNTMAFIGQAIFGYSVPSPLGEVSVRGQPGFELQVTVTPGLAAGDSVEVIDKESWFSRHAVALAVIGLVALTAIAIAAAPETGGASLTLLALAPA